METAFPIGAFIFKFPAFPGFIKQLSQLLFLLVTFTYKRISMNKPLPSEYNPYFETYIKLVEPGDFNELLKTTAKKVVDFFKSIPASKHDYAYAPGKWTIKEVVLHIADTERVMQYRALTIARGDLASNLPSMDENQFAREANVTGRSLDDILNEFSVTREATRLLFAHVSEKQSAYIGKANGHPASPRALGYIIVGHPLHHLNIVKERYL